MIFKLLILTLFRNSLTLAHYDPAFFSSPSDNFLDFPDWMKNIRDDVRLSELALPGTHNTATFDAFDWLGHVVTQVVNFENQLHYGIRVFDIRYRHIGNGFVLHHEKFYLRKVFGEVINALNNFLAKFPSETVLFRLREEYTPYNNTRTAKQTLDWYMMANQRYLKTSTNIKLGEARGKFIILADNGELLDHGITYADFVKQDNFQLNTNWDLYWKWEKVRDHLHIASQGFKSKFYINYLSGSLGSFPYFVASGHSSIGTSAPRLATGLTTPMFANTYPDFPRVSCFIGICTIAFEGTNILTRDRLTGMNNLKYDFERTVGIIMADYPGTSLIREIISNNYLLALNKAPAKGNLLTSDEIISMLAYEKYEECLCNLDYIIYENKYCNPLLGLW